MTLKAELYQLTLNITLQAPFVSQASGESRPGLDVLMLRTPDGTDAGDQGKIALPGALIKGNLVHAFNRIIEDAGDSDVLNKKTLIQWFGRGSSKNYIPERGELGFDNYWVAQPEQEPARDAVQYRIRVDEMTGAVKEGHFVVIESPYAPGKPVTFTGKIEYWGTSEKAKQLVQFIRIGFELIPALGAFKGVGFGQLAKPVTIVSERINPSKLNFPKDTSCIQIALKPEHAFCFASRMAGSNSASNQSEQDYSEAQNSEKNALQNRFVSQDHIPGNAIKGALINQLLKMTQASSLQAIAEGESALACVARHIENVTIGHGLATSETQQRPPVFAPLSMIKLASHNAPEHFKDALNDITEHSATGVYINHNCEVAKLAFATDWKPADFVNSSVALSEFGNRTLVGEPAYISERVVQIHTKIQQGDTASAEHQLFSYECVQPKQEQCWLSRIVLPDSLPKQQQTLLMSGLQEIFAYGLGNLGKTDVRAKISCHTPPLATYLDAQQTLITNLQQDQVFALQLNSDTQLLGSVQHIRESLNIQEDDDLAWCETSLFNLYQQAIKELSGDTLALDNFFAEQNLIGGVYHYHRFKANDDHKDNDQVYSPELVTLKGSVFLCRVKSSEALNVLSQWTLWGIPPRATASKSWQENPYLNSLGYGQIHLYFPQSSVTTDPNPDNAYQWVPLNIASTTEKAGSDHG